MCLLKCDLGDDGVCGLLVSAASPLVALAGGESAIIARCGVGWVAIYQQREKVGNDGEVTE